MGVNQLELDSEYCEKNGVINLMTSGIRIYNGNLHKIEKLPEYLLNVIHLACDMESVKISLKQKTFGFVINANSYVLEHLNGLLSNTLRLHIEYILTNSDNLISHIIRFKNCRLNDMIKTDTSSILRFKLDFSYEDIENSNH